MDKQGYGHLQHVMTGIAKPGSYIMEEAAKEIERLRAENAELAECLEQTREKLHGEIERLQAELVNSNAQLHNKVIEAREAARQMYHDVNEYDPNDLCPGWLRQMPWLEAAE